MTMKSFAFTALFLSIGLTVASPLTAQGRASPVPANIPPSSFEGLQFVDNNGCIYVRAGFDGNVTWVPRVSRQRTPICGQTPTFRGATAAAAPAPTTRNQPVQITLAPEPAPAAAAPAASATAVAAIAPRPAPAPVTVRRSAQVAVQAPPVVRAPSSKTVAVAPRVVRKAPVPAAQPAAAAPTMHPCVTHSGIGQRSVGRKTITVRCAPQTVPHVNHAKLAELFKTLPDGTRIIPRHVYEQRVQELDIKTPYGYRPAWEDDRLNPHRAIQTVEGYNATQKIWTNTVPRESVATAKKAPEATGVVVGRTKAHSGVVAATQGAVQTKAPVVSTRSAPAQASQYVRVGAFTTEGKARAAAARLQAAGLPVRFGRGKGMVHVMVGPYASASGAAQGLKQTHAAGYVQAYLR